MMLAIEEMQSQVRAENGIKERIIGYVGRDWEPEPEELDVAALAEAGFKETKFDDLPEDIRDIVLAEHDRLKTGKVQTVESWKKERSERISG
jgi:hypothetical protein